MSACIAEKIIYLSALSHDQLYTQNTPKTQWLVDSLVNFTETPPNLTLELAKPTSLQDLEPGFVFWIVYLRTVDI